MILVLKAHRVDADRENAPKPGELKQVEFGELFLQPLDERDEGRREAKADLPVAVRVRDGGEEVETLGHPLPRILLVKLVGTPEGLLKFRFL